MIPVHLGAVADERSLCHRSLQLTAAALAVAEAAVMGRGACPDLQAARQLGGLSRQLALQIADIDAALATLPQPSAPPAWQSEQALQMQFSF